MHKNPRYPILAILISALLVSVLFNMRVLFWVIENGLTDEARPKLYYLLFNTIIEFAVFVLAAWLNYSWIEKGIRRFSIRRGKVPFMVLSNLGVYFILIPAGKLFHTWYFLDKYENKEIEFDIENYLIINITVFLLAIVVARLLVLMKKMRIAEQENLRLMEEKSKAELNALKEQISPHFFFNTLSTLSAIVRNENKEVGLEFIGEISKTFHYTLASKQDLVPLKEEIAFLESYMSLLKKRFGEKLSYSMEVSEKLNTSHIPPMSLQLLVENAIQHNVITRATPLHISIYVENDLICVENNLEEKETKVESFGIGLQNLADRYQLLSQKDIIITKDKKTFSVKLPLLKHESTNPGR